ncbi:MAG: Crp/Fnr family transcriptional regulator [Spirochaetales bacterium]|nr:Crp/Fnr family transcriptional regulator [Spirochaetales bacterium]
MKLDMEKFGKFAVRFEPGQMIFAEHEPGNSFFFVQSGRVQIVKILDDIEKNIDILQPGEIFGEMAILEEEPRSASAVALDKCVLLEFTRENFEIIMAGYPQMALKLLKTFTKRIYDQKRCFLTLTLDDEPAKVADVFLMLAENLMRDSAEGVVGYPRVEFKASIEDIAHWAGMSVNKCREILNHLASQRKIEIYADKIVVTNINDMSRYVKSKRNQQK